MDVLAVKVVVIVGKMAATLNSVPWNWWTKLAREGQAWSRCCTVVMHSWVDIHVSHICFVYSRVQTEVTSVLKPVLSLAREIGLICRLSRLKKKLHAWRPFLVITSKVTSIFKYCKFQIPLQLKAGFWTGSSLGGKGRKEKRGKNQCSSIFQGEKQRVW